MWWKYLYVNSFYKHYKTEQKPLNWLFSDSAQEEEQGSDSPVILEHDAGCGGLWDEEGK